MRHSVFWVVFAMLMPLTTVADNDYCPLTELEDLAIILWPFLDLNGDHGISFEELTTALPSEVFPSGPLGYLFSKMDTNGNGLIDPPEAGNLLQIFITSPSDYTLADLDANGDGVIQYSEVADFIPQSLFDTMDVNNNGVLDCEDMPVWPPEGWEPGPPDPCEIVASFYDVYNLLLPVMDRDGSGAISLSEARFSIPGFEELLPESVDSWEVLWGAIADANNEIDYNGAESLYTLLGFPAHFIEIFDANGDLILSEDELSDWLSPEEFGALDQNNNNYIDCESFEDFLVYLIVRNQDAHPPLSVAWLAHPRYVQAGNVLRLSVSVTGAGGVPTYIWRFNGETIPLADGPELAIFPATYTHAGFYLCEVMDETMSVVSTEPIYIDVVEQLPAANMWVAAALVILCCAAVRVRGIRRTAG